MKEKLFRYICTAIMALVLALPSALPTFAETSGYGPGYVNTVTDEASADDQERKGEFLGMFATTGYCNCSKCSGGHGLTYSGTVPTANHTLSADLTRFPLGTKLMINDVIYTVEDMGSGVNGDLVDIYYATHEEALAHGMNTEEVFAVIIEDSESN